MASGACDTDFDDFFGIADEDLLEVSQVNVLLQGLQ